MLQRVVMAVVVLAGLTLAQQAVGAVQNVTANGQNTLASIDADDDGMIEEPEDCNLSATVQSSGMGLTVMGTQSPGPNLLLPCTGTCSGFGSISTVPSATTSGLPGSDDGLLEVTLNSCTYSQAPFVPMVADFCNTSSSSCSPSPSPTDTATSGGTAGGFDPLSLTFGEVFQTSGGFVRSGFGRICDAGTPVVQINAEGTNVIRTLEPFPNAQNPTHMCVDNVPVELAAGGKVFRTACFPIENGMVNFSLGDGSPFAIVELLGLPPCSRGTAPTMTQWGMMLLVGGLLAFGVWQLGRRQAFSETLSLL